MQDFYRRRGASPELAVCLARFLEEFTANQYRFSLGLQMENGHWYAFPYPPAFYVFTWPLIRLARYRPEVAVSIVGAVVLVCARIALNVGDSRVIDIGVAGVVGADHLSNGWLQLYCVDSVDAARSLWLESWLVAVSCACSAIVEAVCSAFWRTSCPSICSVCTAVLPHCGC